MMLVFCRLIPVYRMRLRRKVKLLRMIHAQLKWMAQKKHQKTMEKLETLVCGNIVQSFNLSHCLSLTVCKFFFEK